MSGVIAGIDPGLSGAIALLSPDGTLVIIDMPTLKVGAKHMVDEVELARIFDLHAIGTAVLERVATRPGEGAVGAFSFGRSYGLLRGILRAHFVPIVDVTPQRWQRDIGIKSGGGKDVARALAKEHFQRDAGLFARVKDDGRADAALMALWGRRQALKAVA